MARARSRVRTLGALFSSVWIAVGCAEAGSVSSPGPLKPGGNGGGAAGGVAGAAGATQGGFGGDGGTGNTGNAGSGAGGNGGDGGEPVGGSGGVSAAGAGGSGNSSAGGAAGTSAGGSGAGGSGAGGSGAGGSGAGGSGAGGSGAGGSGAGGSGGGPSCDVVSYNFSGCSDGWSQYGNGSDWACATPTSGPGADHTTGTGQLWATNPSGNSSNCSDASLESPVIDLSSGGALRLRFWHWYNFRACVPGNLICNLACIGAGSYSGGVVEVKNAGGAWTRVAPTTGGADIDCYYDDPEGGTTCSPCELDGVRGFSGASGGWVQQEIDISGYAHAAFQVRFHFASYGAEPLCHPGTAGWYIDDVRIAPAGCP